MSRSYGVMLMRYRMRRKMKQLEESRMTRTKRRMIRRMMKNKMTRRKTRTKRKKAEPVSPKLPGCIMPVLPKHH